VRGRRADRTSNSPYRLDELGWLQFERLGMGLLAVEAGLEHAHWTGRADEGLWTVVPPGLVLSTGKVRLRGPTLVVVAWIPPARVAPRSVSAALHAAVAGGLGAVQSSPPRSLLLITNLGDDGNAIREVAEQFSDLERASLGARELGVILDARPELRRRVPSVLGVRELDDLIEGDLAARSSIDLEATRRLPRVFVPTHAYARTLDVLERHSFAVLTGPPEVGKTAIARIIALIALTEGREAHECVRPDQLWRAFARERAQLFIADDAFGSTEYRPDAAERWALELDRVLRAMDARHWLIWTSRPSPLKAGLRRIHREHGVERFPQPAEVQVAANDLDLEEKVSILFRHARAASLSPRGVELVQTHGWDIVDHRHFTPERIRRFVEDRLLTLSVSHDPIGVGTLGEAVQAEIREPTTAMAASLHALGREHRALLVALLDAAPGPVSERELAAAVRRHSDVGFTRSPGELVDRLTDHFLRIVPPMSVTWVHPSWRDLLIDDVATDCDERRWFLARCALEGVLLALSIGGGASGERAFPLLVEDADWDLLGDRIHDLLRDLDDGELIRLLVALAAAAEEAADDRIRSEVDALAERVLDVIRRRWNEAPTPVPVRLLEAWFALAALLPHSLEAPRAGPTWIQLLPGEPVDVDSAREVGRLDEWLGLAALLGENDPAALRAFGFPERQRSLLDQFLRDVGSRRHVDRRERDETGELLVPIVRRLESLVPDLGPRARAVARTLRHPERPRERVAASDPPRHGSWPPERSIVARVLRDLDLGEGG
jgi:hypothetical protein